MQDIQIRASLLRQATQKVSESKKGSGQQSRRYICVTRVPVSSPDQLDIGDHVVFHRRVYDHHGIITDKKDRCQFEVIEATKESSEGEVKITCSWKKFENPVTGAISKDNYSHGFSKEQTAQRAKDIYEYINEHPGSYEYNLFTNNCEHFATYCATKEMYSLQVAEVESRGLISYIRSKFDKKDRNQSARNMYIPIQYIGSKINFEKGDIIEFYLDSIRHVLTLT